MFLLLFVHYLCIVGLAPRTQVDDVLLNSVQKEEKKKELRNKFPEWLSQGRDEQFFAEKIKGLTVEELEQVHIKMENRNTYRSLILSASLVGNESAVWALIKKGVMLDDTDWRGRGVLFFASQHGWTKVVQYLNDYFNEIGYRESPTKKNYDVGPEERDMRYTTSLHIAARQGHLDVVKILSVSEVSYFWLDEKDGDNLTPLDYAMWFNHINVVAYLLKAGVPIQIKEVIKMMPEMRREILELILEREPSLSSEVISEIGTTLHDCLLQAGREDLLDLLIQKEVQGKTNNQENQTSMDLGSQEDLSMDEGGRKNNLGVDDEEESKRLARELESHIEELKEKFKKYGDISWEDKMELAEIGRWGSGGFKDIEGEMEWQEGPNAFSMYQARSALRKAKEEKNKQQKGEVSLLDKEIPDKLFITEEQINQREKIVQFAQRHQIKFRVKFVDSVYSFHGKEESELYEVIASNQVLQEGEGDLIEIKITKAINDIALLADLSSEDYGVFIDFIILNELIQGLYGVQKGNPQRDCLLGEQTENLETGSQISAMLSLLNLKDSQGQVQTVDSIYLILSQVISAGKDYFYDTESFKQTASAQVEQNQLDKMKEFLGKLIKREGLKQDVTWHSLENWIQRDEELARDLSQLSKVGIQILSAA